MIIHEVHQLFRFSGRTEERIEKQNELLIILLLFVFHHPKLTQNQVLLNLQKGKTREITKAQLYSN